MFIISFKFSRLYVFSFCIILSLILIFQLFLLESINAQCPSQGLPHCNPLCGPGKWCDAYGVYGVGCKCVDDSLGPQTPPEGQNGGCSCPDPMNCAPC